MSSKKITWTVFLFFISLLFTSAFLACVGSPFSYRGAWVKEENQISLLEGGPHQGQWQTRDLSLEYEYRQGADHLQISGNVKLANYLTSGFTTLDNLFVNVHFLEGDGKVLQTIPLKSFGNRLWFIMLDNMSFNNRLELPEGAVAIAFGYRGKVSEGGSATSGPDGRGDKTYWEFWETPRRKPPE
jgi:hypothetical protein